MFLEEFYKEEAFSALNEEEIRLSGAEFYKCRFESCSFGAYKITGARFESCQFVNCDFSLAIFKETELIDVEFDGCKLIGVDWTLIKNRLQCEFKNCKLDSSSFYGMPLKVLNMIDCSARDADFEEADLTKADLSGCDLLRAKFNGANLSGVDLRGARSYSIDPNKTKVKKAKFSMPEVLSLLDEFDIIIK